MPMAIRFRGQEHKEPYRLHTHTSEYPLVNIRRFVGMDNARILWGGALHYGDRNSIWQAAFQDGWSIACAIRQGC